MLGVNTEPAGMVYCDTGSHYVPAEDIHYYDDHNAREQFSYTSCATCDAEPDNLLTDDDYDAMEGGTDVSLDPAAYRFAG